jgi:S-adenosylmethionine decarboxylase
MKKSEYKNTMSEKDANCPTVKFGRHLLVDFYGCNFLDLNDKEKINQGLVEAVFAAGATLIDLCAHKFSPYGVTGTATLSESHICIHTWPENNYAAIDIFTCGKCDPYQALQVLDSILRPKSRKIKEFIRGILHEDEVSTT